VVGLRVFFLELLLSDALDFSEKGGLCFFFFPKAIELDPGAAGHFRGFRDNATAVAPPGVAGYPRFGLVEAGFGLSCAAAEYFVRPWAARLVVGCFFVLVLDRNVQDVNSFHVGSPVTRSDCWNPERRSIMLSFLLQFFENFLRLFLLNCFERARPFFFCLESRSVAVK